MSKRFYCLIISVAFVLCTQAQQAGTGYWQQQVDYSITAVLNDSAHTLDGFETITYHNRSPDSLDFIWMHLWPNAYKNDKTAFSEQKLTAGQEDFYFSGNKAKGYINRLDFKINGVSLLMEDHPQYIDVIRVFLPQPLAPGDSAVIQTPFHLKLPYRFSRLGHIDQHYSLTQWYPKAAVYDKDGWHPMPYLEWGEYYNDFGNYKVAVTVPANYVVAATGTLLNQEEISWMKAQNKPYEKPKPAPRNKTNTLRKERMPDNIPSAQQQKTLHYTAENVTDFAWFADKSYLVKYDTIRIDNNTIDVWNFIVPGQEKKWENSMVFTKSSLRFYSEQLGPYPYPQVSVVCDPVPSYDGMEYPMITILNTANEPEDILNIVIAHEVGHNWLQAIIANNERLHPWMDEGFNTYFERKYRDYFYEDRPRKKFIAAKLPEEGYAAMLDGAISRHTDQPIETPSEEFTLENYVASSYEKTSRWLNLLEEEIGKETMQLLMHTWYDEWKFKHPKPADFKALAEKISGQSLDEYFELLYDTGPLYRPAKRKKKITGLFNLSDSHQYEYIGIAPAIGFNNYDKLMIGALVHNYNNPATAFRFVAVPLFATGSKQLTGYGRAGYNFYPDGRMQQVEIYASAAKFNIDDGSGLDGEKVFKGFNKITPGIYLELKKKQPTASLKKWMDIRTWIINEQKLEQKLRPAPADTVYYDLRAGTETTIIPQVSIGLANERGLYPWRTVLAVQQVKQVIRTTLTADYFLNYNAEQQGISVRFFFGKLFYTKPKTNLLRAQNSRYHFTMYGPNGYQDYTYSNAFAERNQSTSLLGRQIMMRDGGFKYRSDYSAVQPGLKTNGIDFFDNWLAAANFTIDIPDNINPLSVLPVRVPLKVFADVGTSASPWEAESELPKFLYSIGLQLPLFKIIKVYYPLVQSTAFKEPNSVNDPTRAGGPAWWQKRLTFSVDIDPIREKLQDFHLF